ncbi:C40 family peptidase [Piscirickettsia litoralis]|uniref:Uncharacterized protein n=1 Tax=Piscirickettsia litoralis TaxID=1891921 RepID=A0ABX3A614_9GAMM|nr:YiiX/YebB-like N1pC/P60 family cysteine hydrolase [Piscirickettsia litoralis]ODN41549.1 hypothetical protein BGC07_15690 [Piscirickettsia litoralis]
MRSGDLIAYRGSGLTSALVRWATHSEYSHVGVVINVSGQFFVAEAMILKGVRITPIDKLPEDFERIKTPIAFSNSALAFVFNHLGDKYSIVDALFAAVGLKQVEHNGWQCAEFAAAVLNRCGFKTEQRRNLTPIELIDAVKN